MADTWQELLRGFPSVVAVPVLWGDMDAFQHVNNTVYFRYFETGRIAYFQQIGFVAPLMLMGLGQSWPRRAVVSASRSLTPIRCRLAQL